MAEIIVIQRTPQQIVVQRNNPQVVIMSPGPQGPVGPQGPAGTTARFEHVQASASTVWPIQHDLGYFPLVAVIIDNDDATDGVTITHIDVNNLTVNADVAISGRAECI